MDRVREVLDSDDQSAGSNTWAKRAATWKLFDEFGQCIVAMRAFLQFGFLRTILFLLLELLKYQRKKRQHPFITLA